MHFISNLKSQKIWQEVRVRGPKDPYANWSTLMLFIWGPYCLMLIIISVLKNKALDWVLVFNAWGGTFKCWLSGEIRRKKVAQPNRNLIGEREAFSCTTISRSLLVSGTHYSLHSRNLEQNIWRIINKSQEGILNLSPHPEQSVILETERREFKSFLLSLISMSQIHPGNVLNLSVFICYMELQCPLHREFLWESQRSVHEKYLPQSTTLQLPLFSHL